MIIFEIPVSKARQFWDWSKQILFMEKEVSSIRSIRAPIIQYHELQGVPVSWDFTHTRNRAMYKYEVPVVGFGKGIWRSVAWRTNRMAVRNLVKYLSLASKLALWETLHHRHRLAAISWQYIHDYSVGRKLKSKKKKKKKESWGAHLIWDISDLARPLLFFLHAASSHYLCEPNQVIQYFTLYKRRNVYLGGVLEDERGRGTNLVRETVRACTNDTSTMYDGVG